MIRRTALTFRRRRAHNPDARNTPRRKRILRGVCLFVPLKASAVQHAIAGIRAKAKELRESFGAEGRARSLEWAAARIEQALRDDSEELLRAKNDEARHDSMSRRASSCPSWDRTRTLLIQSQACCQLHQGAPELHL